MAAVVLFGAGWCVFIVIAMICIALAKWGPKGTYVAPVIFTLLGLILTAVVVNLYS